jgi:hypothetical protein
MIIILVGTSDVSIVVQIGSDIQTNHDVAIFSSMSDLCMFQVRGIELHCYSIYPLLTLSIEIGEP